MEWDMAKYPIKQSLKNISEIMSKLVSQIDSDLKARSSAYNSLKGKVLETESGEKQSLERKNLTSYPDWQKTHETLSERVIPRSTKLLFEDQDSGLLSVTLFRKAVDDFKHKARENKFTVRGFQYNEEEMKADKEEMTRLSTDKKKQFVWAASQFPGHAASAKQEECKETEGRSAGSLQTLGQQCNCY
ncbi:V-type proton ATPase subunit C 1-B [Carassius auratus]|uniref:V-type proton ATPase subunit C n=1 Tax=Carassius auratus TaxID=7957 RepID=A0A6P6RHR3_CARAU|nr:V-type proton ATPase subunit C 1-A-like [Carassius auratus]